MKSKIVYTVIFVSLFMAVSSIIILLNSKYKNIFKFDFTPRSAQIKTGVVLAVNNVKKEKEKIPPKPPKELPDSLKTPVKKFDDKNDLVDTSNTVSIEEYEKLKVKLKELEAMNEKILGEKEEDQINKEDKDQKYQEWIKSTVKMFESMEAKKAAKIMAKYSDSESRQIIYKMNKKKAAEILAELTPDEAQKITRPL